MIKAVLRKLFDSSKPSRLKIDPKKVEYDGGTFCLIIRDEAALIEKLKKKQAEILKDLGKEVVKEEKQDVL